VGGAFGYGYAVFLEGIHFGLGGVVGAADDGAGVAHAFAGGGGFAGDEGDDGFLLCCV